MAFSETIIKICVLHILSSCLYSIGQGQFFDYREIEDSPKVSGFSGGFEHSMVPDDVSSSERNLSAIAALSLKELNIGNVSDMKGGKCVNDLKHFLNNLESPWALQMFDSTGKVPSGIMKGALTMPGQYHECLSVYSPLDEEGHGGFHGRYCVSAWKIKIENQPFVPVVLGVCVPDSCSGKNIETVFRSVAQDIDSNRRLKKLKEKITLLSVTCKNLDRPLDSPTIIYLYIVSVFISVTVAGSFLTIFRYFKTKYATGGKSLNKIQSEGSGNLKVQNGGEIEVKSPDKPHATQKSVSNWEKILLCFSVFENARKIFDVERTEGQLLIIHGIKVLCIAWVLLGHIYLIGLSISANAVDALKSLDYRVFEAIFQAVFAVDVFFLISGFLMTYIYLREAPRRKISWTLFYLHRLWRLTPPYLVSTFFFMFIFKYMGSGPFWDEHTCDSKRSGWWKYILYMSNFLPPRERCALWTWYLDIDVQFYAISPLFLYPLWKRPKVGFAILGSVLFASWCITGFISHTYNVFPSHVEMTVIEDYAYLFKRNRHSFEMIYSKPYCRIGPYIVGIILGYILNKTADKKVSLNRWQQFLGWSVALCCLWIPIFGFYRVEMTKTVCLIHNVFIRTVFSVGVAWIIYVCQTGHGGFVTKALSWKPLIPLSRLTFSVYLIHIIVIQGLFSAVLTPIGYRHIIMVVIYIGVFVMCFVTAFVFSLLFESPFLNLESLLLRENQVIKEKQK